MAWTKDQQNAIDARNCNLLVSAAAGSGKTAVLIERIIKRVTDSNNPIDIDSIVVVTFTRAAAQEMKTRLGRAFENALSANPGNRHLIKQISLVDNARITTIDSFCTYILRNYYNSINLEPDFRVAEEGELNLIKEDVLSEILEERFIECEKDFLDFIEAFAPGKSVDKISELVFNLHRYAQSNPWPLEWLLECEKLYQVDTVEEYEKLDVVKGIVDYIHGVCTECANECDYMIELCNEMSGPVEYVPAIESDKNMWMKCCECDTLNEISQVLSIGFAKLATSRKSDKELRDKIQAVRKNMKARREKLVNKFCMDMVEQLKQLKNSSKYARVYLELVKEFTIRYQEYKQSKNIVDFSDVEHYALNILIQRDNGECHYTDVADELATSFNEIYIDEYQDSNLVQEYILNAVSKERFGTTNTFMVGDVKQSIYKFRMARPQLFMSKYDTYANYSSDGDDKYYKIELHKNFRSRENVLESINDVFNKIMHKNLGGIEYTDDVRLNCGMEFDDESDSITELIITDEKDLKDNDIDKQEACAHLAADRIKQMMSENPKLRYRDFVILLRSDKIGGPVYSSVLASHDIPSIYASTTGYFTAYEVVNVLDFLSVIDNPRQEIPLAGLMRSYFAYFDAEELATIKGRRRRTELYDCVCDYAHKDDELGLKCAQFVEMIDKYRKIAGIYTISEIISKIVYESGYYDYVGAMIGGKAKKANLDMLVQKATDFESTSYSGLFNFLRYIEKLQKYDVDYGEGQTDSDEDDLVRIMSIHKSKGLEFPVVIIGDFGKRYNLSDSKDSIVYDSDFGIGMDYVDIEHRTKETVVYKNMIAHKITADAIGEELRILYVAMTRAVDKLIMIGNTGVERSQEKWEHASEADAIDMTYLVENTNYLNIVAPCAVSNSRYDIVYKTSAEVRQIMLDATEEFYEDISDNFDKIDKNDMDAVVYQQIKDMLEYTYPYCNILSLKSKYSVSDLKHAAMEESEVPEARIELPEREKVIPSFIQDKEKVSGVFRGNAYHKVFELLDYGRVADSGEIKKQLEELVELQKLPKEYYDLIDGYKFVKFMETELGRNMQKAYIKQLLYREQPFIMEVGANEVGQDFPADEKVLIQGIIDAFYIEDDEVFIVDYKTDRVPKENGEQILIERYKKQLELYCGAIKQITGMNVRDCYIYSVALNKAISIF